MVSKSNFKSERKGLKQIKIVSLESEEGQEIIKKIKEARPIVLVGSAISAWGPTNLPPGKLFTEAMLKFVFPKTYCDSLDARTKKFLDEARKNIGFEILFNYFPDGKRLASIMGDMFLVERFNAVHQALADGLTTRRFAGLITPNYDLCLDKVLGFSDYSQKSYSGILRVVTKIEPEEVDLDNGKVYFKIHGSANNPEAPPIFRLAQESRLPEWKRGVLHKTLTNRTLLVIGYSGSDFEICPEIMEIPLKDVFWNINKNPPSQGADQLVLEKRGCFLKGDLCDLLSDLLNHNVKPQEGHHNEVLLSITSQLAPLECQNMAWRASIMNNYGFVKEALETSRNLLALPSTKKDLAPDAAENIRAASLFHIGKYKLAAILWEQLARRAETRGDRKSRVEFLANACGAWRNYGGIIRSYRCLDSARAVAKALAECKPEEVKHLFALVYLQDTHQLSFHIKPVARRVRSIFGLEFLSEWVRQLAQRYFQEIMEFAADSGDWYLYYNVPHWALDLNVEPSKLTTRMKYPPPPPPAEGWRRVGYFVGESIAMRTDFGRGEPLTKGQRKYLDNFIEKCFYTGNYPEAWKLLRVKMKRSGLVTALRLAFSEKFRRSFFACQYTIPMRVIIFFNPK